MYDEHQGDRGLFLKNGIRDSAERFNAASSHSSSIIRMMFTTVFKNVHTNGTISL